MHAHTCVSVDVCGFVIVCVYLCDCSADTFAVVDDRYAMGGGGVWGWGTVIIESHVSRYDNFVVGGMHGVA